MTARTKSGTRFRVVLGSIVVSAFSARLLLRVFLGQHDFWQSGYAFYAALADQLIAGHGYSLPGNGPTAGRLPLYPLLLAGLGGTRGSFLLIAMTHSAISAATVAMAGLIARERWSEPAGLVAAGIAAAYPYFLVHDTALQESGLFALSMAAATLALWRLEAAPTRRTAALSGVLLGLATLARATAAPFAALAIAWAAWRTRRVGLAATVGAALLVVLSPWIAWTYDVTGWVTLSSDTGRFIWVGNNPDTFAAYPEGSIDRSQEIAVSRLSAEQRNALFAHGSSSNGDFAARATAFAAAHPAEVLKGALRKIGAAFGPLPSPRMSACETGIYMASWVPVLLLGLAGLWRGRNRWRSDALVYAHFVAFVAVTVVFWAHTSHRAYLDVFLIVFAAGFLTERATVRAQFARVFGPSMK